MDRIVRQIHPEDREREGIAEQRLSAFLTQPNIVLLGDPGAGKSHTFRELTAASGGRYLTARSFLTLPVRTTGEILFVDGFDERRGGRGDRDTVDALATKLIEADRGLPLLFEDKVRTRMEPKAPGEDDYSFYDSSARPAYDVYRVLLNGWMNEMSASGRKDLLPRFRRNESLEYQTALAELTTHAALKKEGYGVEVHPENDQTDRKPDFLARDANGETVAYVEATTFGPSRDFVGKHKRAADVYNGVDKAKLPTGCRLGLDIRKHGSKTPSLKKLRGSIEKWAASFDAINPDDPPSKIFEIDDWKIETILFGGFRTDVESKHAIATAMGDPRIVTAETEIREAPSTKGKRYGKLDAPYLIVVADCKEELQGGKRNDEALIDAVFVRTTT